MTYFSRKKARREMTRMVMRLVPEETTNSSKTKNIARKILIRVRKWYGLLLSNQNPPLPFSSSPPLVSARLGLFLIHPPPSTHMDVFRATQP